MYRLFIRPLLFLLPPESAHNFTFGLLKLIYSIPGVSWILKSAFYYNAPSLAREAFGIHFPNPIGLAAGFDKDAKILGPLSTMGFGFIEIGTLTPKPQDGNPLPRMFRLPKDQGLINRMGFNNQGAEAAIERLKNRPKNCIVGGNIGKNKSTPNDLAHQDYISCFETLYPYVDYFVINVSSPNTPGLRDLQEKEPLSKLITKLQQANKEKLKPRPILLKVAPDLTNSQLDDIIEIVNNTGISGVVATNTTISRDGLETSKSVIDGIGQGGLSGKPVRARSTEVIRYLSKNSNRAFPIIGVGGINSTEDVIEKLEAGATLVQIYTGFIYQGPSMVSRINKSLNRQLAKANDQ